MKIALVSHNHARQPLQEDVLFQTLIAVIPRDGIDLHKQINRQNQLTKLLSCELNTKIQLIIWLY
jgi:hypothetical protein